MSIYEKLGNIQVNLKCNKSQYNSFGNFNYRSCEDIYESAKKVCVDNKTTLVTSNSISVEENGWVYVEARATLYDWESEQNVSAFGYAREPQVKKGMDDSQVTGTASSYAMKRALGNLFCLDDTKDADTEEYHNTTNAKSISSVKKAYGKPKESTNNVSSGTIKKIENLVVVVGQTSDAICKKQGVKSLSELTEEQGQKIVNQLSNIIKKKGVQ